MIASGISEQFGLTLEPEEMAVVMSFGIGVLPALAEDGSPPTVCIALGINGEIDAPAVLRLDCGQAADVIARLQAALDRASAGSLN